MSPRRRRVRNRYVGDPTEAAQERLLGHVVTVIGAQLSREAAQALLERANAWTFIPMRQLDQHLTARPDALAAPDPHAPRVLLRLIYALVDAGLGHAVTLPSCAGCGRSLPDLQRGRPHPDGIGRCCQPCMLKAEQIICARCGRPGDRAARRDEGVICRACYGTDPARQQQCAGCGRRRQPTRRTPDGRPLCQGCAPRPVHVCVTCALPSPAHAITDAGSVCRRCYRAPERRCGGCGRPRQIKRRAAGGSPDLCAACAESPVAECGACGRWRHCQRGPDGLPRCPGCRPRPLRECALCRRRRTTQAHWPLGPVCSTCYSGTVNNPGPCATCGQVRVLVGRDARATGVCGPCAIRDTGRNGMRANLDYLCASCGEAGDLYAARRCARCVLTDRVTDLLGDDHGTIDPQLLPFADALVNAAIPRHALAWLRRSGSARLLAELAATRAPVTHEVLDELLHTPKAGAVDYLRKLLVATSVLPDRLEPLARLEPWLDALLVDQPADRQRLVRPFAQWVVLRKARRAATRGRYTASSATADREDIHQALALMSWLGQRNLTIDDLTQPRLDEFMTDGRAHRRRAVRAFTAWTAARRITPNLVIARRRDDTPSRFLAEDHHLHLLRRCLTPDDPTPVDVKVAGGLILLYGVRLPKIHALTTERLSRDDRGTYLALDSVPVLLPPTLAQLVDQLIAQPPRTFGLRPTAQAQAAYLFPGRPPTRPIAAASLGHRLRQHGIPVGAARNNALIALAADLPAPVITDLFGLTHKTAATWSTYARADWTAYLNSRPDPDAPHP
ncbi:hypothetical protein ACIODS_27535 [Micromonospora chalcea]|uniref:hypothetical protein n=2 Tax=Micromonosporaceae TaxID=28056 RepID=UPI0008284728|nr:MULTISPECIES: hypothetical protein [Micromonospora]MDG4756211.1 hypothetical protein [Micromonospora sp. WMMD718]SCL43313.1 hypothetical protein GA0070615_6395 [Micromonospora aurantiaca]